MAKEDSYFQFPIHALHFGKPLDDVTHDEKCDALQRIVRHSVWTVGTKLMQTAEYAYETAEREAQTQGYEWFQVDDENHVTRVLGAKSLKVKLGGPDRWHPKVMVKPKDFGSRLVRLRCDLLWDYHNNSAAAFRDLAVLSAIYSGIGQKQYAKLSYEQIRCMAMGYNGIAEYEAETRTKKKDNRLTVRQTQYTAHRLHDRGFFVRVCPNKRHIYYSHKLTASELAKAVVKKVATYKAKRVAVAAIDKAVSDQINSTVADLTAQFLADLNGKKGNPHHPR